MKYQFVIPREVRFWLQKLIALVTLLLMVALARWVGDGTYLLIFGPVLIYLIGTRHVWFLREPSRRAERINRMLDMGCGLCEIAEALGVDPDDLIEF